MDPSIQAKIQNHLNQIIHYERHLHEAMGKTLTMNTKLPKEILDLEGMSSHKIRVMLNNLCENLPGCYLEIGSWKGSTFISAMYKNTNIFGVSVDHHQEFINSQFKTSAEYLKENCEKHLINNEQYKLVTADCFKIKLTDEPKFNIYLYDGAHDYESQYKALTYYYYNLNTYFYFICDDFSTGYIENATRDALRDLDIEILSEYKFFGNQSMPNAATTGFWNGYYVALCVKRDDIPEMYPKNNKPIHHFA